MLLAAAFSAAAQTAKLPSDLEISLERTMCYGTCPDYTLKIKADRTVVFNGGRFTATKGTARSRITKEKLTALVKEFDRIDFLSYADDYSRGSVCDYYITDLPSQIISIRRNGKTKTVNHYFGCTGKIVQEKLKPLRELGNLIDTATNSKRWVGK